jgi:hypothetical protein
VCHRFVVGAVSPTWRNPRSYPHDAPPVPAGRAGELMKR